jgi:hypothetical protein
MHKEISMKMYFGLGSLLCLAAASVILAGEGLPAAQTSVDFGKKLQAWDGFGVHYVETHHSRDYKLFPENYGGFNHINAEQREQVIRLVFGPDGLKPGLVKAWAGPFQEPVNDNDDPYTINPAGFDHQTTTKWIRYFGKRGLEETRKRGDDLTFLAGLYAPPKWVTRQKVLQGAISTRR